MSEFKLVALLSVIVFMLLGPTGFYLISFQGEGLAGDIGSDVGRFILLPPTLLHRLLGANALSVVLGVVAQFFWFMAWVAGARWFYLRKQKKGPPPAA